MNWNNLLQIIPTVLCIWDNISDNQFHRSIVLPFFFFLTVNGQTTTQCPVWKPDNGKRNMIRISLIVITMVLAVICIAYFALLVFEKYLVKKHREENIYVNQVITAWFRHCTDEWNHIHIQRTRFSNDIHEVFWLMNLFLNYAVYY